MPIILPDLPYSYDALEPFIDARTVEVHHAKHHRAYVEKTNAALQGTGWEEKSIEDIIAHLDQLPEEKRMAVRNNGGGVLNHNIYWTIMGPAGAPEPSGELKKAIDSTFGDFATFRSQFTQAALTQFGSGWAWLVVGPHGLLITQTSNQDSPLTEGLKPILALDVWEHAYYLKYQNRRPEYVEAFWSVVHWQEVERRWQEVTM